MKLVPASLNVLVFTFYGFEFLLATSYLVSGAQISDRMIFLPFLNSTAYLLTVLLYSALGIFLYLRTGWKSILPIGIMGAIHDLLWNVIYSVLHPEFPGIATASQSLWAVYIGSLAVGAPIFWVLQSRYLHPRYYLGLKTLLFPAYVVSFYVLIGLFHLHIVETSEPTFLIIGNLYILTLFASYLGTVKFG